MKNVIKSSKSYTFKKIMRNPSYRHSLRKTILNRFRNARNVFFRIWKKNQDFWCQPSKFAIFEKMFFTKSRFSFKGAYPMYSKIRFSKSPWGYLLFYIWRGASAHLRRTETVRNLRRTFHCLYPLPWSRCNKNSRWRRGLQDRHRARFKLHVLGVYCTGDGYRLV